MTSKKTKSGSVSSYKAGLCDTKMKLDIYWLHLPRALNQ